MKVVDEKCPRKVKFNELRVGELFHIYEDGEVYLKISEESENNCFCIGEDILDTAASMWEVYPRKGHVVLTERIRFIDRLPCLRQG